MCLKHVRAVCTIAVFAVVHQTCLAAETAIGDIGTCYEVFRNTTDSWATASRIATVWPGDELRYVDTPPTAGDSYWYWVRAYDTQYSSYSIDGAPGVDGGLLRLITPKVTLEGAGWGTPVHLDFQSETTTVDGGPKPDDSYRISVYADLLLGDTRIVDPEIITRVLSDTAPWYVGGANLSRNYQMTDAGDWDYADTGDIKLYAVAETGDAATGDWGFWFSGSPPSQTNKITTQIVSSLASGPSLSAVSAPDGVHLSWGVASETTVFSQSAEGKKLDAQGAVQWRVEDGGNGHWYDVIDDLLSWEDAQALAEASGGYLATLTSLAENNFVRNLIASHSEGAYQLGGYQLPGSTEPGGGWTWVTDEGWTWDYWRPGEPNNGVGYNPGPEDYLLIYRGAGDWGDFKPVYFSGGAVIEYVPEPMTLLLLGLGGLSVVKRKRK